MKCPRCGGQDFAVEAVDQVTAYLEVNAAGEVEQYDSKSLGHTEWDENSSCRCLICQHTGPVRDFDGEENVDVRNPPWTR